MRELLLLFIAFAAGLAALLYANFWWLTTLKTILLVALIAGVIIAILDCGARRATAAGFVIGALFYSGAWLAAERSKAPGSYLTSALLSRLYETVQRKVYVDVNTDREYRTKEELPPNSRFPAPGESYTTPSPRPIILVRVSPSRADSMAIGEYLWTCFIGYLSGHFARHIYLRRKKNQLKSPS